MKPKGILDFSLGKFTCLQQLCADRTVRRNGKEEANQSYDGQSQDNVVSTHLRG